MNSFLILLTGVTCVVSHTSGSKDFGVLDRIVFKTSDCLDCGMSIFGQINVKLCGGGPEPCCAIVNIAKFNSGHFQEGQIDEFYMADLQDCQGYQLTNLNAVQDVDMTVYHEGPDAGQLDWVEVITTLHRFRCNIGFLMEEFSSYKLNSCFLE